ncbi:hypothetical protein [Actinomadura rupiterrae]|uniref:hypothetical protein n=1 Tax=Actinomadura rupiterrae TaxID=559627 RepID=UPI0020A5B2D1|nr:hypothetical protein [Actinomadura rupiterrae]MCP2338460.1 hypothetical protein [Actinomadura rupiterrae]
MAAALAVAAVNLYWIAGGDIATNPHFKGDMDANGRVFGIADAFWATAGAWSAWVLARRGPRMPLWIPVATAFIASGSMAGWGAWRIPWILFRPMGYETYGLPAVAAGVDAVSIAAGIALAVHLVRAVRGRSSAPLPDPR